MSKLKLLAGLLLLLPSMAMASVTHVTLWEPLPGKSAQMMATAAKAVELNKKTGNAGRNRHRHTRTPAFCDGL